MSSESSVALHLITRHGDARAWRACGLGAEGERVEVILLHGAVLETPDSLRALVGPSLPVVWAGAEHARLRSVAAHWPLLEYPEIIQRCAEAARMICW